MSSLFEISTAIEKHSKAMYLILAVEICVLGIAIAEQDDHEFALTYLKTYGYLSKNTFDANGDDAMTSAIMNMQREFGLTLTGTVDAETLTAMKEPRCAMSDFSDNNYKWKRKWPSPHFYYHIENHTPDLGKKRSVEIIQQAQREWMNVTPITYTEMADEDKKSANISIRFVPDNGKMPKNTVAWAYGPYCTHHPCLVEFKESVEWQEGWPPGPGPTDPPGGRKCFTLSVGSSNKNAKRLLYVLPSSTFICPSKVNKTNWLGGARFRDTFIVIQNDASVTVKRTDSNGGWGMSLQFKCCVPLPRSRGINLLLAAMHELGHTLGLIKHSNDKESIMYPAVSYRKEMKDVQFANEDIWRVQQLYGIKGTAAPPPTMPTTPNPCRDYKPGWCEKWKHICQQDNMQDLRRNCMVTCGICTPK